MVGRYCFWGLVDLRLLAVGSMADQTNGGLDPAAAEPDETSGDPWTTRDPWQIQGAWPGGLRGPPTSYGPHRASRGNDFVSTASPARIPLHEKGLSSQHSSLPQIPASQSSLNSWQPISAEPFQMPSAPTVHSMTMPTHTMSSHSWSLLASGLGDGMNPHTTPPGFPSAATSYGPGDGVPHQAPPPGFSSAPGNGAISFGGMAHHHGIPHGHPGIPPFGPGVSSGFPPGVFGPSVGNLCNHIAK